MPLLLTIEMYSKWSIIFVTSFWHIVLPIFNWYQNCFFTYLQIYYFIAYFCKSFSDYLSSTYLD